MTARTDARPSERSLLVELLRCPDCDAPVAIDAEAVCSAGHAFPIVDGVIVMVDEQELAAEPQYAEQRRYFDAEFRSYERYRLENRRLGYVRRLRAASVLDGGGAPLVDVASADPAAQ